MSVRRQYGFNLIEIMIAVAILAIISAIAIPLYEGYIVEARFGTAQKDVRQMQLILDDLALDNDLGSLEPAAYTLGTDLGVYQDAAGAPVLGTIGTPPAGTTPWLDPWARIYRYQRPAVDPNPNDGRQDYLVFSQGADTSSTADDLHN